MEENMPSNKTKFYEKMDIYFDESNTSSNFHEEQNKEKLQLRKNKIFNILFSKRKELIKKNYNNDINDSRSIDIKSLNCDEEIKKDPDTYIRTKFDIKKWFKYFFSSNKNDILVSLFLIDKYVGLQLLEIKDEKKRKLSRNDTELIQHLCDNLLNDDIKIIYNSCTCLTNLTLFPANIENRIYSERNLEKILKFFNVLSNNLASLGYEALYFFINICFNHDVKIYLVKHSFLENFYNFVNNIINNKSLNLDDRFELNTIKICVSILSELIKICQIDDNYIKRFLCFIPICKIITSKYYANIDNLIFDESQADDLITIWKFLTMNRENRENIINEIIKDNFLKVLILLYYKIKEVKLKVEMFKIFSEFLSIGGTVDLILINDGIIQFLSEEIERNQYSNVELLNYIIFSISNLTMGNMGTNELLFKSQVIFKIIDITNFHIDDKLDKEITILLKNSIFCLANFVNGCSTEIKKNILNYKNFSIIIIFCKALKIKLNLEFKEKKSHITAIIYSINELNVVSEELDPDMELKYDILIMKHSLKEIINNYSLEKNLDESVQNNIEYILDFIKDKEKNI